MKDNNIFKIATAVLVVAVIVLVAVLVSNNNKATKQIEQDKTDITSFSNRLAEITDTLTKHDLVITNLETDLTARQSDIVNLSNTVVTINADLDNTKLALTNAQAEIAKRDEAIAKLEAHNQALEAQANELDTIITNLNAKIEDITQKLATSEGDKVALTKELQRLTAEKAELERRFNDISELREQVKKIKREINISRRLDRAAEGLPADYDLKGGQQQLRNLNPPPPRPKHYDLNVEVKTDGSVKVIPPLNQSTNQ